VASERRHCKGEKSSKVVGDALQILTEALQRGEEQQGGI
jgi:hypothetical protein